MVFARSFCRLARPASLLSARAAPRVARSAFRQPNQFRTLTASASQQGKVLLVLYDVRCSPSRLQLSTQLELQRDKSHTIQGGKHAEQEPNLLGTTENELGLRKWIEEQGHELITTSDKEGENSEFDKHLVDAEVIITTPYVPRTTASLSVAAPQPTRAPTTPLVVHEACLHHHVSIGQYQISG